MLLVQQKPESLDITRAFVDIFQDRLRFNSVVVLESLPPGDLKTGTELYEQVLVPAAAAQPYPFPVRLESVPDAASFHRTLGHIEDRARRFNHWPILHLEAHGCDGVGLVLADSSVVPWQDVLEHLIRINRATRFNLLVTVSACFGADVISLMYPSRPAPFWAAIGPPVPVTAHVLLEAFKAFYSAQLGERGGVEGIRAMRAVSPALRFYPAELLFRIIFFRYIEKHCTGVTLDERVDDVFEAIVAAHPDALEREPEVRAWLRSSVFDHAIHFERAKAECFMFEDIPENRERVLCTFADGPPPVGM
ncbi:MAG: hypothetical protein ABMA15_23045 [Vicinamibacterales bacterium]